MKHARHTLVHVFVYVLLTLTIIDVGFAGDAEVSQNNNLQINPLQPSNADITYNNNLIGSQLQPSHSDIIQTFNLIGLQLIITYADVIQTYNLQGLKLEPNNADVTTNHNLITLSLEQPPSLQVNINSFTITDQNGNPNTAFAPGSTIFFKIVVSSNNSQNIPNALISIMVQDPTLTPIFLGYAYEDILLDKQTTIYLGFQIPYNCILGEYTAKLNIFTNFPSQGGQPIIGGSMENHFNVS